MIEIIPAIDIIEGKCVRLSRGDYDQKKVYNDNPLEVAFHFEQAGLKRLHLVDLDGAKAKHIVNYKTLEQIAAKTKLTIDFGGGIKSEEDLTIAFNCGASQVTAGSIAATDPEKVMGWIDHYGQEKIIIGADVKNDRIAINGWQEKTSWPLNGFISNYKNAGASFFICTDIEMDGMLQGASVDLYKKIIREIPGINIIASGGVAALSDIAALEKAGCYGVIIGKAFYEGKIKLQEISEYLDGKPKSGGRR